MQEHTQESPSLKPTVLVSRQAIYTPQIDVWAYMLRFLQDTETATGREHEYQSIAQGLLTSVLEPGLDVLVGNKLAFIPLTRGFLLLGYSDALPPERVVLVLPVDLVVDHALCESLHELVARGYALALDGRLAREILQPLMAYTACLTLDVSAVERSTLAVEVANLRQYARPLVAMQVQTWEAVQACCDLGFAYIHGPFVCQPDCVKAPSLPTNRLALLHILAQLQDPRSSIDALTDLISQDVTLSYRLLRAINAACYGLARPVLSIREAVRFLGLTSIILWTSLMLLAGNHAQDSELLTIAMMRADMCAQFARALAYTRPDTALLVGLFSVLSALLNRPMQEILQALPLAEEVQQALLTYTGILGAILHAVLAYEHGDWAAALNLGLDHNVMRDAYGHALTWTAGMHAALAQATA